MRPVISVSIRREDIVSTTRLIAERPPRSAYMYHRCSSRGWQVAGDHDAVICRVVRIAGPDADRGASASHEDATLETRHLREAGII